MQYFIAILAAYVLAQLLFAAGMPPWVLLVLAILTLVFRQRVFGMFAVSMIGLSGVLKRAGLPGSEALLSVTRWLASVEDVQMAGGGHMQPSDVDEVVRDRDARDMERAESAQAKARQDARDAEVLREAQRLFDGHAEDAVFLVEERNGSRRGHSKIGGRPTLPKGVDWPQQDDRALHFLAEIHLDEVPRHLVSDALPTFGVLYFFLDLGEYSDLMDGCVLYAPEAGAHRVRRHPDLGPLQHGFMRQTNSENLIVETAVRPTVATVPHITSLDYGALDADLNGCLHDVGRARFAEAVRTQGLVDGLQELKLEEDYVYNMVGGPKLDIPNETMGHGVKLLQLDSADSLGLRFGDMGVVEFWIAEDDLRAGRFERAFVENATC